MHNVMFKRVYSDELAKYLHLLCYESYFSNAGKCIPKLVDYFDSFQYFQNYVVTCDGSNNQCAFFILISKSEKCIIIVFSGTLSTDQLLKQTKSMVEKRIYYLKSGMVNKYYANSMEKMWPYISKFFELPEYSNYHVITTGHSLGSVFATLAAYKIGYLKIRPKEYINSYTFGGPRIGSREFAQNVDRIVPNNWRITVSKDFIPHLPPCKKMKESNLKFHQKIFKKKQSRPCDPYDHNGYYHAGTEVWYPLGTGYKFTICNGYPKNEDFSCSDQFVFHINQLKKYRKQHSMYFQDLIKKYWKVFYYYQNKECKIIEDPKYRRPSS